MSFVTLAKKELKTMFTSTSAYLFLAVFLFLSFWLFLSQVFLAGETDLRGFFAYLPLLFLVFLPSVSMGVWAEEKSSGTIESLSTLPVSPLSLVLGKFLATLFFLFLVLFLTTPLAILMSSLGDLDWGPVWGAYLGSFLLGMSYLAVGQFFSIVTKRQIVAFLLSVVFLFVLYLFSEPLVTAYLPETWVPVFHNMSASFHFGALARGVMDARDVIYFLSFTAFFLFLVKTALQWQYQKLDRFLAPVLLFGILFVANTWLSSRVYRVDLTQEKIYTLSDSTKTIVEALEDRLTVKVHFSDDLPTMVWPLRDAAMDLIKEVQAVAPKGVNIEFEDPGLNEQTEQEAINNGIKPIEVNLPEKDKIEVRKLFLGLSFYYKDKKEVIPAVLREDNLEYLFALKLFRLTQEKMPRVGFYYGGEKERYQILEELIRPMAQITAVDADSDLQSLQLDALFLVEPNELSKIFLEQIDQALATGLDVLTFSGLMNVSESLKAVAIDPGMQRWWQEKGVEITEELVLDPKNNLQAGFQMGMMQVFRAYPFWLRIRPQDLNRTHVVTQNLEDLFLPWVHSVSFLRDQDYEWQAKVLVRSSEQSFLQPDSAADLSPEVLNELQEMPQMQSFPLFVELNHANNKNMGRLFLLPGHYFLRDEYLNRMPSNAIFISNLSEYVTSGQALIGIRSRGKSSRPLMPLSDQARDQIKWFFLGAVPVMVLLMAVLINFGFNVRRRARIRQLQAA
ncbi:MAG: Gldg family protein [Deltaproteobacteria bacterium]|nr:Gldg family protein [Deltaproteobacteria bacterium]